MSMVIIITGDIGIGKTTVCRRLIEIVQNQGYSCGGILTYKAPDKGITIEGIQSGETENLASTKNVYHGPRTAKYYFNAKGIAFGVREIEKGISSSLLVVDEIGHLELRGEGFTKAIELIRTGKVKNCVLVIRKELLSAFLPQLNTEPSVFETTLDNRDQLPQEIGKLLAEKLANNEGSF